jgi:hypothetical protein
MKQQATPACGLGITPRGGLHALASVYLPSLVVTRLQKSPSTQLESIESRQYGGINFHGGPTVLVDLHEANSMSKQ